jgi:hypothetical protein
MAHLTMADFAGLGAIGGPGVTDIIGSAWSGAAGGSKAPASVQQNAIRKGAYRADRIADAAEQKAQEEDRAGRSAQAQVQRDIARDERAKAVRMRARADSRQMKDAVWQELYGGERKGEMQETTQAADIPILGPLVDGLVEAVKAVGTAVLDVASFPLQAVGTVAEVAAGRSETSQQLLHPGETFGTRPKPAADYDKGEAASQLRQELAKGQKAAREAKARHLEAQRKIDAARARAEEARQRVAAGQRAADAALVRAKEADARRQAARFNETMAKHRAEAAADAQARAEAAAAAAVERRFNEIRRDAEAARAQRSQPSFSTHYADAQREQQQGPPRRGPSAPPSQPSQWTASLTPGYTPRPSPRPAPPITFGAHFDADRLERIRQQHIQQAQPITQGYQGQRTGVPGPATYSVRV